jgi:hypothetical protein
VHLKGCCSLTAMIIYSSYKHKMKETLSIQQLQGNTSTAGLLSSSLTPQQSITNEAWQTNHPTQALYSSPCSSVGTLMPAQSPVPLDFANIHNHARYIKKLPLHSPTVISRNAPATKGARVNPPGPAASSPSACKSFAGWPMHPELSTEKGTKG